MRSSRNVKRYRTIKEWKKVIIEKNINSKILILIFDIINNDEIANNTKKQIFSSFSHKFKYSLNGR